jgi:hypothetical protein
LGDGKPGRQLLEQYQTLRKMEQQTTNYSMIDCVSGLAKNMTETRIKHYFVTPAA